MSMQNKITVLGSGAFGTAVAAHLANNGHNVILWCYEPEVAKDINKNNMNGRYLPGIKLPKNIQATSDLGEAIKASTWIFEAVPTKELRSVFIKANPWFTHAHRVVVLSKGIEAKTLLLPSDIIAQSIGLPVPIVVLSGPNLAHELAQQVPCAAVVASSDQSLVLELTKIVSNQNFKIYGTDDVIGVQVCGALKNVMALVLGAAHGKQLRENTIALLITQALHEMAQVAVALGGRVDTSYGVAGLGDLILCCTGASSRNFKVGRFLGQGHNLADLSAQHSLLPEGVGTLRAMKTIAQNHDLDLPLSCGMYEFVFEDKGFDGILARLMGA